MEKSDEKSENLKMNNTYHQIEYVELFFVNGRVMLGAFEGILEPYLTPGRLQM